jgi:hypothetical protein
LTIGAALTANLARFAVLCGVGLVLAAVGLGMSEAVAAARATTGEVAARFEFISADSIPASLFVRPAMDHTAALVVAILTIGAAVASILMQYQTRLRRRSIPIGLAGLLVAVAAGISWPWALLQPNASPPDWTSAPEALQLVADPKSITTPTPSPRFRADRPQLVSTSFRVTLEALPPEWIPTATLVSASLRLPGLQLESAQMGYPWELSTGSSEEASQQVALRQALRVARLLEPARGDRRVEALFLRDDDVQRYAPAVGRYTARFRLALTHPEVVAAVPLKPGATGQAGALRVVVDGVSARSGGGGVRPISPPGQIWNGMVAIRESNATSLFDRAPASNPMYFIRNSRLGEAVRASAPYDPGLAFPLTSLIHPTALPPRLFLTLSDVASSGFRARSSGISFVALTTRPTDDRDALEAWLADAELVIIRMVDAGFVDRTLDITEFPLVLSPRAPNEDPALVVAPSR